MIEVEAEAFLPDGFLDILIGGGNDTDVHAHRGFGPHRRHPPLFQDP